MVTVRQRYWTLAIRHDRRFFPEFGSFVRFEAIAKMSEWRRKGVCRSDLKIIASDPDLAAITKDVEALNDAQLAGWQAAMSHRPRHTYGNCNLIDGRCNPLVC